LAHAEKSTSLQTLIADPFMRSFKISPDGKYIAFIGEVAKDAEEPIDNLYLMNYESKETVLLTAEKANVNSFVWVNNERIIYSTDGSNRAYGGLYGINIDKSQQRTLIDPVMSSMRSAFTGFSAAARVLDKLADDDGWILTYVPSDRRQFPNVAKLNVYTGRTRVVEKNMERFRGYLVDGEGNIRIGYEWEKDGSSRVLHRPVGSEDWSEIQVSSDDTDVFSVLSFKDTNTIYLLSNIGRDKVALFEMNLENSEMKLLHEDPVYDLTEGFVDYYDNKTGELIGFRFDADLPRNIWLHEEYGKLQELIDQALPGTFNYAVSRDENTSRLVIGSFSDQQPTVYYLLDVKNLGLEKLIETIPDLDVAKMGKTKPISFNARDGRKIHGYLTLPPDYKKGQRLPLIVEPHGGPWARDTWGYRWYYYGGMVQMPVMEGFAVLTVDFRGSTGYGRDHLKASFKNADLMNYDVQDGVQWAVDQGYADPDRLGIMGASWGGYATMWGVTKSPDFYQYGINIFGVVDLPRQINWYRSKLLWDGMRESGYEYWARRIGDPSDEEDRKKLEEWSPINYVKDINVPVMIYHGVQDRNVDIEQSRILVSEMKEHDKEYEWISKADEHHTISNMDNRIEYFERVRTFLRKHGK
jgi:dipeptidyl aminopeptidase/acylaminoacyl peptidase